MLKIVVTTLLISSCWTSNPANVNIIDLSLANFDILVSNSDQVWIVEFFSPRCSHCVDFLPKYRKFADAVKGVMKVGAVNIDKHDNLRNRFNVLKFPTIMIFNALKYRPAEYKGPFTTLDLIDEALGAVRSKVLSNLDQKVDNIRDIIEITDSTFNDLVMNSDEMWLVEFYAPWCGHCNRFYPEWATAATELKGKVKLGMVDATTNQLIASVYNVKSYPTIKYFARGKKDVNSVSDYNGSRSASDIVAWALETLAVNSPIPDVEQIVDNMSFRKACGKSVLCILSFLPHILDCPATCRNQYLDMLKDVRGHFKKYMWGWVWSEADAQYALEYTLDVGGFGYPTMAVINTHKMKYSVLRGAFSSDGITEFLRDITFGRGSTAVIQGAQLPDIVKIAPWDGKDGILPLEEEEIQIRVVIPESELNVKEDL